MSILLMNMGEFVSYTFQSGLVLLGCYLAYKWLLAWRNEPRFSRSIILGCYCLALIVPALNLSGLRASFEPGGIVEIGTPTVEIVVDGVAGKVANAWPIVKWIYLSGMFIVLIATVIAWLKMSGLVARGERLDFNGRKLVVIDDDRLSPMSWMGYIIMSQRDFEGESFETIVSHEIAHLNHHHTIDLVVAQLYVIVMWYNPASWLMARELRAVHEFQADKRVIECGADAREYQLLLVKKAVGPSFPALANSMNHSNLKKRITMMQKSKSSKRSRLCALSIVPAIVLGMSVTQIPAVAGGLEALSASKTEVNVLSECKVTENPQNEVKNERVLQSAETMPQFPGGEQALLKFISENITFPESEYDNIGTHLVIVKFEVGADGKVANPEVVRSQGEAFDKAALDVINKLPAFKPGTVNGEPVAVWYTLPVKFKTQKNTKSNDGVTVVNHR